MTQRNDQTLKLTQLGQNQRPGIGQVVSVEDVKNITATIKVADSRGEFRSRQTTDSTLRLGGFALCLHDSDTPDYFS